MPMQKTERIARSLLKSLRKANRTYHLIADGDRIAVGVSGGKDSQTLLRLLHQWQSYAPVRYELVAVHIGMEPLWLQAAESRDGLETWFQSLNLPHHIRPLEMTPNEPRPINCFRCSWNRRKTLFRAAVELGCNKVALGHHADDIAETALMNLVYHGRLESMAPRKEMFDGQLTIIRPLALVEERRIVYFARAAGFWKEGTCCPHGEDSQRARMKETLRSLKKVNPKAQVNLFRAVERAEGWLNGASEAGR